METMSVPVTTGAAADRASWPHYFGASDARLFGCHHPVPPGVAERGSVLLCHPMGHEYLACYRTMRQAAVRLAQAGWGALRFDFFGSGDSAGTSSEGRPERWLRDVAAAAEQLRARSEGSSMSLLGLRLGASLALGYAQGAAAVECDALVLWDPVVNGRDYVAGLSAMQRQRFGGGEGEEALGAPFGPGLRAELERIDLLTAERPRARRVLIVETGAASPRTSDLEGRLRLVGANVSRRRFETAAVWSDTQKTVVPNAVIQAVAAWMRGS